MRYFLFLLFIAFIKMGVAQTVHSLDSVKALLNNHPQKDSIRINLLLMVSRNTSSFSEGLAAEDEAISIAQALGLKNKLAKAYYHKASNFLYVGKDSLAYEFLNKSITTYQQTGDQEGLGFCNRGFARYEQNRGAYYKAIGYYQKAFDFFEKVGNFELMGNAKMDIGVCYYLLSDYVQANNYYIQSKKYFESAGKAELVALILSNMAMVQRGLKKYSSALEHSRSAFAIQKRIGDSSGIARSLQGIGLTYDLLKRSDSALYYYQQALEINLRNDIKLSVAENYTNIGIVYKDLKDYERAYFYLTKGVGGFEQLNNLKSIRETEVTIAELLCIAPLSFFNKGTIQSNQRYIKAASLFNEIISYSKGTGNVELESQGWEGIARAYEKQGEYKMALEAQRKFMILRDSIINEEKVEETTRQIEKVEYEKKEAVLNADHQSEIKQQATIRKIVIGGSVFLIVGGFISFLFYKRNRDAVQKQKEAEFKAEVADTEMKALRAQMNPHFIFNSLNSISDYIAKNKSDLADEYLTRFAKLMRMILENSEQKEVPLSQDLIALELYMQLESQRMNNKFTYEIKVEEGIDKENTLVPPLLLQPFVENSIWHGIARKQGSGKITINIKQSGGMISCIVEDDGVGRTKEVLPALNTLPKKSLGMKITRERIAILNKVKGSNAGVELSDLQQGTRVEVRLPLELSF